MFKADDVYLDIKVEDIKKYVTDYDIFRAYCSNFAEIGKSFRSEFYLDNNPSCRVYPAGQQLKYIDFGHKGHNFNCYEYIMHKYHCTFPEALRIVANDFGILDIKLKTKPPKFILGKESKEIMEDIITKAAIKPIVTPTKRNWNYFDLKYWEQYSITFEWLDTFKVTPISKLHIVRGDQTHSFYSFSEQNDIMYHYKIGNKDQIYRPYARGEYKWMKFGEGLAIGGYDELPATGDLLIITKSLKDVILYKILGFDAIEFGSEITNILLDVITELRTRFKEIVVQYDNDETGINAANKLQKMYDFRILTIPKELDAKDLSDLAKKYNAMAKYKGTAINLCKGLVERMLKGSRDYEPIYD